MTAVETAAGVPVPMIAVTRRTISSTGRRASYVGNDIAFRQLKTERSADKFNWHLEKLFGKGCQLIDRPLRHRRRRPRQINRKCCRSHAPQSRMIGHHPRYRSFARLGFERGNRFWTMRWQTDAKACYFTGFLDGREFPNATARVHHSAQRCDGLAGSGARAAPGAATDRLPRHAFGW